MVASNISSILQKIVLKINKIQGISYEPTLTNEGIVSSKISFIDQCFDKSPYPEIDNIFYTSFRLNRFTNRENADKFYSNQINLINRIYKRISTFIPFITHLKYINNNTDSNSSFFYNQNFIGILTSLIIKYTYKVTTLQIYQRKYRLLNEKNMQIISNTPDIYEIPELTSLYEAYINMIYQVDPERLIITAHNISKHIISALKKRYITVNFCQIIQLLENDKIFPYIIRYLCTYLETNAFSMFSNNSDDIEFIMNTLLFINRISKNNGYQEGVNKIIMETVQVFIKTTLIRYKDFNYPNIFFQYFYADLNNVKLTFKDIRLILNETQPCTLSVECLTLIVNFIKHLADNKDLKLNFLTRFFIKCFKSDNKELVNKSAFVFTSIFNREYDNNEIDFNNPDLNHLFHVMFSSRHYFDDETSNLLINIWEKCGPFLSNKHSKIIYKCGLMIDELSIDMYLFLKGISDNIYSTDYHSLFFIVSNCFSIVLKSHNYINNQFDLYSVLFLLLGVCCMNQKLHPDINSLMIHISNFFSSQIITSESCEGFLAVISEGSKSRSYSDCMLLNLADNIIQKVYNTTGANHAYINHITDRALNQFIAPYTLLLLFHILSKYFLKYILPIHIKALLTAQFTGYVILLEYNRILEGILKKYLDHCNEEVRNEVIQILYCCIGLPQTSCRQVILDVLLYINAKVPPVSSNDIKPPFTTYNISTLQKMSLSYACGEPIKRDQFNIILSIFGASSGQTIHEFSYRCTFILNSLIRAPNILDFLDERKIISCLKNTLSIHQKTVYSSIMKAFKILVQNTPPSNQFIKDMKGLMNDQTIFDRKTINNYDNRFRLFKRLTKVFPDSFETKVIDEFIKYFHFYNSRSIKEREENMLFPIHFLKILSNDDVLSRRDIQDYLNEKYSLLFSCFLDVKLSVAIPYDVYFMKYFSRFLTCFSKYGKNTFLIPFIDEKYNKNQIFTILYEAILEDVSFTLLNNVMESSSIFKEHNTHMLYFADMLSKVPNGIFKSPPNKYNLNIKTEISHRLYRFANNLYSEYKNPFDISNPGDNNYIISEKLFLCLIRIFRIIPDVSGIFELAHAFEHQLYIHSNVYKKFNKYIFNVSQDITNAIVEHILNKSNNLTPRQLFIMLPNAVVKCNSAYFGDRLWNFILEVARSNNECGSTMVKTLYKSIRNNIIPPKNKLERICNLLPIHYVSSDIEGVFYSFKLSRELQKRNLLPPILILKIFELVFSYIKFFENPHRPIVIEILTNGKSHLIERVETIQKTLVYCVGNFIIDIKQFSFLINIFHELPFLIDFVTVPLLTGFITILGHLYPSEISKKDSIKDIDDLYYKVWSMLRTSKYEYDDLLQANNAVINFLNLVFEKMSRSKFAQDYFDFITQYPELFPYDLIEKIDESNFSLISLSYLCSLAKVDSSKLNDYHDLIILCIKFFDVFEDMDYSYLNLNLTPLFEYVQKNPKLFMNSLKETLDVIPFNEIWTDKITKTFEAYMKMLDASSTAGFIDWSITFLKNSINQDYLSHIYSRLFRFFILSIQHLSDNEQTSFLNYLFDLNLERYDIIYIFQSTPKILLSELVTSQYKQNLLSHLMNRLDTDILQYIPDIVTASKQLEDFKIRLLVIDLLMLCLDISKDTQLLKLYNLLQGLLPSNFPDRLDFVFTHISVIFFRTTHLHYLTSLLVVNPIFGHTITVLKPGDMTLQEIIRNKIIEFLNQTGKNETILKLLNNILSLKTRRFFNCILECIFQIIITENIKVDSDILLKLYKRIGNSKYNEIITKIVKPNIKFVNDTEPNDFIYSHYRESLSKWESIGILLCNTNLYKPAHHLFNLCESLSNISSIYNSIAEHYSCTTDKSITSILKVFTDPSSQSDKLSLYCSSIAEAIQSKQVKNFSQDYESSLIMYGKGYKLPVFEKILCFKILGGIASTNVVSPSIINRARVLINPYKFNSIENLIKITKGYPLEKECNQDSEAIFLISPKNQQFFENIVGYTPSGLVGITEESLIKLINSLKNHKQLTVNDWSSLAPIFFHLYSVQNSSDVYQLVFNTYSYLLNHKYDLTLMKLQESLARLTTLMKTPNVNKSYFDTFKSNIRNIFKKDLSDHWIQFYPHILEAIDKSSLVDELFPGYFPNILQTLIFAKNIPSIMKKMTSSSEGIDASRIISNSNEFFNMLFNIDHDIINRMTAIIRFVRAVSGFDISNLRPLDEILSSKPVLPIEYAIHNIDYRDLSILNRIDEIKQDPGLENALKIAREITNCSTDLFVTINERRLALIKCYNFILNQVNQTIKFYNSYTKALNSNTIVMSSLSTFGSQVSIVQRINIDEDVTSKYLLSNLVCLISDNFYGARSRCIPSYKHSPVYLSENYVLSKFDEAPLTLQNIIDKASFKHFNNETQPDTLKKYLVTNHQTKDYIAIKYNFICDISGNAIRRVIMNAPYPSTTSWIIVPNRGFVPFLLYHDEHIPGSSNFRLSPNISTFIGDQCKDIILPPFITVANSIASNYDLSISIFEVVSLSKSSSIEAIIENRNKIFDIIQSLSPPERVSESLDIYSDWFDNVNNIISNAMNPSLQPQDAYPWI